MRQGHQASTNGRKAVAAQQIQSQGAQQRQHLHSIALSVAMGVLALLGVSGPVPLVFDRPALAHQLQYGFGVVRSVAMKKCR